jgi:hypothetical protein
MSKAVNLTGGVTDIRRRELAETGLSHGTQRVGPVDIEIGGSTVAHQEGNPFGGQRGVNDICGVVIDTANRHLCVGTGQPRKGGIWGTDRFDDSGISAGAVKERELSATPAMPTSYPIPLTRSRFRDDALRPSLASLTRCRRNERHPCTGARSAISHGTSVAADLQGCRRSSRCA